MPNTSSMKVAIVGAGPAGLTLARLLSRFSQPGELSYTVYELDASPTARIHQGGTLDLHPHTGLAAIKKCDLWDSFQRHARYEGEALVVADKRGKAVFRKGGGKEDPEESENIMQKPEIDRERLKEILLAGVPAENVQWGYKLREVTEEGTLRFENTEQEEGPFDLIVGCDGAWSKVRTHLTDVKPVYSGISGLELRFDHPTTEEAKAADKMIGRGSYFCYSDNKSLQAQRLGDDSIQLGCWGRHEDGWAQALISRCGGGNNGDHIKQTLIDEHYADWSPELQAWIQVADPSRIRPWSLYELPVGHHWPHYRGVTLIGDAAHLATPFAGEGVNAAMADALDLAEAISTAITEGTDLDSAVTRFETEKLWPRGDSVQDRTVKNKDGMFAPDAPAGWMEKMRRRFWVEVEKIEDPVAREKAIAKMKEIEEKSRKGGFE